MKKYIFLVEIFYFVYIIIKNVHLNTYKSRIYKFLYLWIFPFKLFNFHSLNTLYILFSISLKLCKNNSWEDAKSLRFLWNSFFSFSLVIANGLIHNITNRKPVSRCIQASAFWLLKGGPPSSHLPTNSVGMWHGRGYLSRVKMPRLACIPKNEKAPDCVDSNAANGVSWDYFHYIFL